MFLLLNSAACKDFEDINTCEETIVNYNVIEEVEWIYDAIRPLEAKGYNQATAESTNDYFKYIKLYRKDGELYYVISRTKSYTTSTANGSSGRYVHTETIYDCNKNKLTTFDIRDQQLSDSYEEIKKWD